MYNVRNSREILSPMPEISPTQGRERVKAKSFDYDNQAWVLNGVYIDCGHDHNKPCPGGNCFGRTHNGEPATGVKRL
jgi:hypothetical protein